MKHHTLGSQNIIISGKKVYSTTIYPELPIDIIKLTANNNVRIKSQLGNSTILVICEAHV